MVNEEITDHKIKRVFLEEETQQIRAMQLNAPEFTLHYPKHREWLDMAIGEILEGGRVAFEVRLGGRSMEMKVRGQYELLRLTARCTLIAYCDR